MVRVLLDEIKWMPLLLMASELIEVFEAFHLFINFESVKDH
jgi:hypothetical protein